MAPEVHVVPLDQIFPSSANPRREIDPAQLTELADSIRQHGILQPVVVRETDIRRDTSNGKQRVYELVCGHRRLAAAKQAGLEQIPVTVRQLTDREVLELQLVENLQRADIHPLDEAEGYRRLHQDHGYRVEDLAVKVGKSRSYVYGRLKLLDLPPKARELWHAGELTASTALLVARIPDPKLAERAAWDIAEGDGRGQPYSYRLALELIEQDYMRSLMGAPFPVEDADLVPAAGACGSCPKRTGNQAELFGDIDRTDVCTDPPCFAAKTKAHGARALAQAKANGKPVLSGAQVKRLFYRAGSEYVLSHNAPYIEVNRPLGWDMVGGDDRLRRKAAKSVLGKEAPELILAADPDGRVIELYRREDVKQVLAKSGKTKSKPAAKSPAEKKRQIEALVTARTRKELVERSLPAAQHLAVALSEAFSPEWSKIDGVITGVTEAAVARAWHETLKAVARRRGLDGTKTKAGGVSKALEYGTKLEVAIISALRVMTTAEKLVLLVELHLQSSIPGLEYPKATNGYAAKHLLEALGVDPEATRAQVRAEVEAQQKAATAKKPREKTPAKPAGKKKAKSK